MTAHRSLQALLFIPAALVAGCAVDPGGTAEQAGEPVATSSQAVIDGASTTARPEIGMVWTAGGYGCTATLIAPRVAITASQCLVPQYTGTAPAGSILQLTDARSGVVSSFGIDDSFSFYPEGDIALVHLAGAVPASLATPATLVGQEPAPGTAVTYYGYGCPGYGTKRFYTFSYGQTTSEICGSDGGGPGVVGYGPPATGPIWGIASAGSPDVLVPVWYFATQIDAKIRAWDDLLAGLNLDRPGSDYAAFGSGSAAACNASCDADARCQAWAWVASTSMCWLKDGVPDPVTDAGVTSGLPHDYAANSGFVGGDTEIDSAVDSEDCAQRCQMHQQSNCHAWTWDPPTRACHMKNLIPASYYDPGEYSGVFDRYYDVGFDRPGADLRQVETATADDCGWTCATDWRCKAFVWSATVTSPGTRNNCWLKDGVPPQVASPQFTSAVRRGMKVGFAHESAVGPSRGFAVPTTLLYPAPASIAAPYSSANPFVCQSACAGDGWCRAWNLVLTEDGQGWCEIFDIDVVGFTQPMVYPDPRTITGAYDLEFVP